MNTFQAEYRVYGRMAVRITCVVVAESYRVAMELVLARYPQSNALEWTIHTVSPEIRQVIETSNSKDEL